MTPLTRCEFVDVFVDAALPLKAWLAASCGSPMGATHGTMSERIRIKVFKVRYVVHHLQKMYTL